MISRRSFTALPLFGLALVSAVGCGAQQAPAPPPPPPPPVVMAPPPASAMPPPVAPVASAQPPAPPAPVFRITEGIATPESVYYDAEGDRYLVSNINGKPTDADNNGYITEISPEGKITNPKLIAGGVNKVKLDAPKGSAISGGIFYVADITVLRKFDAKTGAPKGDVKVPGAKFLNDVAAAPDGRIFFTDSGLKMGKEGLEPAGGDAVYVLDKGKVKAISKAKDLAGPNGILSTDKGPLVVTFGAAEIYRLDEKGAKQDVTKLPEGGLDGIVALGDGLLVSSWAGKAVFRGKLGGTFEVVVPNVSGAADIGFDSKRGRVLVPRFLDNAVEAYDIK